MGANKETKMKTQTLTIALIDPVNKLVATRPAKHTVVREHGPMFGILSATGTYVDIMRGTGLFDKGVTLLQRIFLKDPFSRCKVTIGGREIRCLGVQL